jgi:hypothetical protein
MLIIPAAVDIRLRAEADDQPKRDSESSKTLTLQFYY